LGRPLRVGCNKSIPSYFLFDAALGNNGTTLADTSDADATGSNQTTTTLLLLLLLLLRGNKSAITSRADSANTTAGVSIGSDDSTSEFDNPFIDFT
jgi:hypothetical protein